MLRANFSRLAHGTAAAFGLLGCAIARAADEAAPRLPLPLKQATASEDTLMLRALLAFAVAVAAAFALAWSLKWLAKRGWLRMNLPARRRLTRVESLRLTQKSALIVVHYHDQELLLAESEQGLRVLARRARDAEGEQP